MKYKFELVKVEVLDITEEVYEDVYTRGQKYYAIKDNTDGMQSYGIFTDNTCLPPEEIMEAFSIPDNDIDLAELDCLLDFDLIHWAFNREVITKEVQ